MTAQHEQWLAAKDCYFDVFDGNPREWYGPFSVKDVNVLAYNVRPSRSPGVLALHDGSDKRPEWVPQMTMVFGFYTDGSPFVAQEQDDGLYDFSSSSVTKWADVEAFMWRMP